MYTIHWKTCILTAVCLCLAATAAHAQGPTITLPDGVVYKAGPDFATDVLQDPWDFSNIEDISPDPDEFGGWLIPPPATVRMNGTGQSFLHADGWMRGTAAGDTRMSLLQWAHASVVKPGRNGATYPIDSTVYRQIAIKMRVTGAAPPDYLTVFWRHELLVDVGSYSRGGSAFLAPRIPAGDTSSPQIPGGTSQHIYVADLAAAPTRGPHDPYLTGPIKGLHIDPTSTNDPKTVEIDWVRLTAGDNGANALMIPVQVANCTGFQHLTVTEAIAGGFSIDIGNPGGAPPASFNAGIFPPGTYGITATCTNGTSVNPMSFTINAPPQVTILTPNEKGDPATDWAALNGDPWDFEQPTDIDRVANVTVTEGSCATPGACGLVPTQFPGRTGQMFRASSRGTTPSQLGDPVLGILEGAVVPINSLKHRILSFSLRNQRPYDLGVGSVARFFWGSGASSDGFSVTGSQDMLVFPGPRTYTIDLSTLTAANGGIETECPGCPTTPWATRAIRHFRIDPHEFGDVPTVFDIDDVTLTAPHEVAVGQTFDVAFAFQDPDTTAGNSYAARIYAQPWSGPGGRTPIVTMPNITPGTHTHPLNSVAIGPGEYRISVEVDEARGGITQTSRAFSTGMLVVSNPAASAPHLTLAGPLPNQAVGLPLTVQGCAYDSGMATGGINVDDVAISMRAIAGPRTGMTIPLGFEPLAPHTGVLDFLPVNGVAVGCQGASGNYANAGYRVTGIGAGLGDWMNGTWVLDVRARSTVSGEMIVLPEVTFHIGDAPPSAPVNFTAHAARNTVFVSWGPATGAASYLIEVSYTPGFENPFYSLNVPQAGQYQGDLPSGTYYIRVFARSASGAMSSPSLTRRVEVALPTAPGPPVLVAAQVSSNPVTLNWRQGPGGAPTAYTIHAGTEPGASNLLIAPMGLATGVTAAAPVGSPVYVRVVAANAAGSAISNEITVFLAPPGPPTLASAEVAGDIVTLRWTPPAGAAPSGYTILARYQAGGPVIASLPVTGTSFRVAAPPGTYIVTAMSHNAQGTSAESAPITVGVPQ